MADRQPKVRWIGRVVVEAVHLDLLREHGGMRSLRDEHALEAVLARARQRRAYDGDADLASLAACYGHGLCRGHPFNDGNKRIAFVTMAVFLGLNGHEFDAPEAEIVEVMMALAAGQLTEEELAVWLRSRMATASSSDSG